MGDVVSLFSVIIMKFKSKFNESKIHFHCHIPWERLKTVKWMNERATSNRAYVPTTVSATLLSANANRRSFRNNFWQMYLFVGFIIVDFYLHVR